MPLVISLGLFGNFLAIGHYYRCRRLFCHVSEVTRKLPGHLSQIRDHLGPQQLNFSTTQRPLDQSLVQHRFGDFGKAGDVRAIHVIAGRAVFLGRAIANVVNVFHDAE